MVLNEDVYVDHNIYASFGRRVGARLFDIFFLLFFVSKTPNPWLIQLLIFCLIYQPILDATGGTLGKRIFGIIPLDRDSEETPSLLMSYKRSMLYLLYCIIPFIALWSCYKVIPDPENQADHDTRANIIVVNKKATQINKLEQEVKELRNE